jgi:hypothetical protein
MNLRPIVGLPWVPTINLAQAQATNSSVLAGSSPKIAATGFVHFIIDNDMLLWTFVAALLLLLIAPTIRYLYSGWRYRRDTVLNGFKDEAKEKYFNAFHPSYEDPNGHLPPTLFKIYYHERFGRRHFILPLILLFLLASCLLIWSAVSVRNWLGTGKADAFVAHHLPLFCVIAISGAYLYALSDQIQRCYTWDLSPVDLYWVSFRLATAAPTAWALRYLVAENLAIPTAFLIGVFPTNTLFAIMRRLATQGLRLGEAPMSGDTELKKLPGIDLRKREEFAAEGITTIAQLAYADPVELTMRMNIDYSYIIDCVSRALLFVYVGEGYLEKLAQHGIRGASEMRKIYNDLKATDDPQKEQAKARLRKMAVDIGYLSPEALENVCMEAGSDVCTIFIHANWTD